MERAIPILPVEDLATAKAFYVNGLGFRVTFEASEDGQSELLGIERGTIQMTLDCPMRGTVETPAYRCKWKTPTLTTVSGVPRSTYCERRRMRTGEREPSTCSTHLATQSLSWGRSVAQPNADQIKLRRSSV